MTRTTPLSLRRCLLLGLLATLAPASLLAADGGPEPSDGVRMRRFALMVGVNDGGASRTLLHFAASDAQAMARVLNTLGGVSPEDLLMVQQGSRAALLSAFDQLNKRVAAGWTTGVRREVVVYYSGHSDETGLLMGGDRVTYDELRARIQAVPADVRLAILDSCASGAFTRHKGGVRRAPFLLDTSVNARGHAFLASSAVNEVAQESNRIGASFFTHYLVSGLRGAADLNHDRRVTLQEAFQFASQETLAHTEKTRGGPQHAAYEFDLAGTSDLVVTDVRSTQATLTLGPDLAGRIGIRDAAGNLVVELRKMNGASIELGLEAGSYLVTLEGGPNSMEAQVSLALGQRADLARLAFHAGRPLEMAAARGDEKPAVPLAQPEALPPLRSSWIHLGLVPMSGDGTWDIHGFSFGFLADRVGMLSSGLQLSLAANFIDRELHGGQMTVGANVLRGPGHGFQAAVGGNYATGPFRGAQIATGLNITHENASGAQIAVGLNIAGGPVSGTQIAAGLNVANDYVSGAQIAAGLNVANDYVSGAQIAAGANFGNAGLGGAQISAGANFIRADAHGTQITAGLNVAQHAFHGTQIAAGANIAGSVSGTQIGTVNLAEDADGLQLGVVNLAGHGRGFALGVVNLAAEHDGEALGVINLIGNGIHSIAAYATDTMLGNLELKLGSRHLYTAFQFAYQPGDDLASGSQHYQYSSQRHGFGLGLGYRQPLAMGRVRFFEVEASSLAVRSGFSSHAFGFNDDGNDPLLASLRLLVGIEIIHGLNAIVGLSENVAVGYDGTNLDIGSGFLQMTQHTGKATVHEYPGILVGLQL